MFHYFELNNRIYLIVYFLQAYPNRKDNTAHQLTKYFDLNVIDMALQIS